MIKSILISFFEKIYFSFLKFLPPSSLGKIFAKLQLHHADTSSGVGKYAIECNNPQALCFLMDIFPILQDVLLKYARGENIKFLDIGPAFGASAGLLSQMYSSDFLGPRVFVDVLDIVDSRKAYIAFTSPSVKFIHSSIEALPETEIWDIIYCSNAIEHHDNPGQFIREIMKHTRGYAIFLAPYLEATPLSPGHTCQISERTFEGLNVCRFQTFRSAAWPTTSEGIDRFQMVAVIDGRGGVFAGQ